MHLRYPSFTNRHPIGINNFQILSENVYDFQQNNPHIVFDSDLNVTFTINEQSIRLSTLLRNTNLGQIRRNDPSTIMERLWELNPDLVFHFDFVPGIDFSPFLTSTTLIIPLSQIHELPMMQYSFLTQYLTKSKNKNLVQLKLNSK